MQSYIFAHSCLFSVLSCVCRLQAAEHRGSGCSHRHVRSRVEESWGHVGVGHLQPQQKETSESMKWKHYILPEHFVEARLRDPICFAVSSSQILLLVLIKGNIVCIPNSASGRWNWVFVVGCYDSFLPSRVVLPHGSWWSSLRRIRLHVLLPGRNQNAKQFFVLHSKSNI